jgi:hypothetical protein
MMRKLDLETAVAAIELQQLVVDYWQEIDLNGGRHAAEFFITDCVAEVGLVSFKGHTGVKKYYADRLESIRVQQNDGIRTTRHTFLNLRIVFENNSHATLSFLIMTFAGSGKPPVMDGTAPVAVSDARFECRCEADGQWRIAGFYGAPVFIGGEDFAKKALLGR